MTFEDSVVKMLCVNNFDTDGNGWLSYDDVANVTSIENVFNGNTEIEYFPELNSFTSVTTIQDRVFEDCTNLKEVGLNNIVTVGRKNGNGTFYNTAIQSVIMPNVKTVGAWAFRNCKDIQTVFLGEECATISNWTFNFSTVLHTFVCMATTPPTMDGNYIAKLEGTTIYVPNESLDAYKTAWVNYADIIKGISELPTDTEFYNKISKYLKYKRI